MPASFVLLAVVVLLTLPAIPAVDAQSTPRKVNEDESKVPAYTLPDPLVANDGSRVADTATWTSKRRPELLEIFQAHVYGRIPKPADSLRFETFEEDTKAFGGLATRRQIRIHFDGSPNAPWADLLLYIPNQARGPVPVFLGYNFGGNQTIDPDPAIRITESWIRETKADDVKDNRATEASRGVASSRWQVPMVLNRGYATATIYYGDVDPDFDDHFQNGVHPIFVKQGQNREASDFTGSIGGWAWGLSRAYEVLAKQPELDASRVAVHGHSRLGKTALWAGAQDSRFALVISNDSGEGGAALARRCFGETTAVINRSFPHWFCQKFKDYADKEDELPIDQHELIALCAPRPVLVLSAQNDAWADPKGEFLSTLAADPVYRLLGTDGLPVKEMPGLLQPALGTLGYHIRPGDHDVTDIDWKVFLDFADRHLKATSK